MACVKLVEYPAVGNIVYLYRGNEGFFKILDREKYNIKNYLFTNEDSIKMMKDYGSFRIISFFFPIINLRNYQTEQDKTGNLENNNPYKIWYFIEKGKHYLLFQDCPIQQTSYPYTLPYQPGQYPAPAAYPVIQQQMPYAGSTPQYGRRNGYYGYRNPLMNAMVLGVAARGIGSGVGSGIRSGIGYAHSVAAQGIGSAHDAAAQGIGSAVEGLGSAAQGAGEISLQGVAECAGGVVQCVGEICQCLGGLAGGKQTRRRKYKITKTRRRKNKKLKKLRRKA